MRADLARLGVGTVLQAGGDHGDAQVALLHSLLGSESETVGGVHVWRDVAARLSTR